MSEKFTEMELAEVCEIRALLVDPTRPETKILPHINGSNIEAETGRLLDVRTAEADQMGSPKYRFQPGDVLYSKLRPNLKKAVIAPFEGLCSADIYPLTPIKGKVLAEYLVGLLLSDTFTTHALSHSARARMPKLNRTALFKFTHLFPPIEKQRIAAGLDKEMEAIEEARQAAQRRVKAAEALEAALFREVFQGITPVVIGPPLEPAPAGWSWQRLSTLADLESGHTPSRRQPTWWGGDIPWISLPDIRALDGKVAMETKENTNPLGISNSSARILPKDTVMLSRTASVGFVAMMGRPMATSQDFVNWVCGEDLSPRFLMHVLRSARDYFLTNASGAIHKTLYMPTLKDLHLCLPTRKQQDQLTTKLDARLTAATEILTAARAELKAIQSLPAAALRRVFGTPEA